MNNRVLVVCIGLLLYGRQGVIGADGTLPSESSLISSKDEVSSGQFFVNPEMRQFIARIEADDNAAVSTLAANRELLDQQGLHGVTPLMWAVLKDRLKSFEALLNGGANLAASDDFGNSALTIACVHTNSGFLKLTLAHGTHPDTRGDGGITLLMRCSFAGSATSVGMLLAKGAQPNLQDANGNTALCHAVRAGHATVAELLLRNGADKLLANAEGFIPCDYVTANTNINSGLKVLLAVHATDIFTENAVQRLLQVVESGNTNEILQIIHKGVAVDTPGRDGITPLYWAILNRNIDGVRALLSAGANPQLTNVAGLSPFLLSSTLKDSRYLQAMAPHAIQVDQTDQAGRTALSFAVRAGNEANGTQLLEKGANVSAKDALGLTALHHAVIVGNPKVVRLLLKYGASVEAKDGKGLTPRDYAIGLQNAEIVALMSKIPPSQK